MGTWTSSPDTPLRMQRHDRVATTLVADTGPRTICLCRSCSSPCHVLASPSRVQRHANVYVCSQLGCMHPDFQGGSADGSCLWIARPLAAERQISTDPAAETVGASCQTRRTGRFLLIDAKEGAISAHPRQEQADPCVDRRDLPCDDKLAGCHSGSGGAAQWPGSSRLGG
jgi:hypothetical protein